MLRPVLTVIALPILVVQAAYVVIRAQRLPEAAGARTGAVGDGPRIRVLIIGDSSAAGVGVDDQRDALAGRLAARLSPRKAVTWTLIAKSGATAASVLRMLAAQPDATFDVAVVALGVNDTKNGVSARTWHRNYAALVHQLRARFGVQQICVSGLPPVRHFPLLPQPLRSVLGRRALRFDQILRALAAADDHVTHVPLEFPLDRSLMASDGFHPGPQAYDTWAERVADVLTV